MSKPARLPKEVKHKVQTELQGGRVGQGCEETPKREIKLVFCCFIYWEKAMGIPKTELFFLSS